MGWCVKCANGKSTVSERSDQGKELCCFSSPTMNQQNPPVTISPAVNCDLFPLIFDTWSNHNPANVRLTQNCFFPFQVPYWLRRTQEFLKCFSRVHFNPVISNQ
jgi:hypothetical protein